MPKIESSGKKFTPPKLRLLLDANLSIKTIPALLELFPFNVKHISEIDPTSLPDEQIIDIAIRENRIILTHDLDYGEIYYFRNLQQLGIIMLRLKNQTTENVLKRLYKFFSNNKMYKKNLYRSLVIITENKFRIFSP